LGICTRHRRSRRRRAHRGGPWVPKFDRIFISSDYPPLQEPLPHFPEQQSAPEEQEALFPPQEPVGGEPGEVAGAGAGSGAGAGPPPLHAHTLLHLLPHCLWHELPSQLLRHCESAQLLVLSQTAAVGARVGAGTGTTGALVGAGMGTGVGSGYSGVKEKVSEEPKFPLDENMLSPSSSRV